MGDQRQIRDECAARVVRDQDERGRAIGRQQRPQGLAVVGDQ
ncbi:hypothetical protein M878_09610 [Streptomyces roseochromogenus subsp. oscitans DS 12.976]|uniref:Uncharacterized protein n=1 Tax=Streptomyces roseochromogenus subsp. oscitans DS 12.976 TaxID=1352936 RepID=V6KR72_STRRC|nr:hypothetical protein M878_09610 [Streptomyces roseochromogenus subsp. oscitans DS 12.976]